MVINGDIISLSKKEVAVIIEKECQKRLRMTAKEFLQKRRDGTLPQSTAVSDIEMMLKLAE